MFVAARNAEPIAFLRSRIIRVAPLYWLSIVLLVLKNIWLAPVLLYFKGVYMGPIALANSEMTGILKDILFIPHFSLTNPDKIWPYLIPGWTLNYEMFFYLLFCASLFAKRPLIIVTSLIVVMMICGLLLNSQRSAVFKTYTDPMMLEFVIGMWIGRHYLKNGLGRKLSWLLPIGVVGLLSLPMIDDKYLIYGRILLSSTILIGTVSLAGLNKKINILKSLGDASYSIYLSHSIVSLDLSARIFSKIHITGGVQFLSWIIFAVSISWVIGYMMYFFFEQPMLGYLRRRPA